MATSLGGVSQTEGKPVQRLWGAVNLSYPKNRKKGQGGWNTVSQAESGRTGGRR